MKHAKAYTLSRPQVQTSAVVFASPHSGRVYERAFLAASVLDELSIRSSEDAFVDILTEDAPQLGAPVIAATMPRAYLDLNRSADELDAAVISGIVKGSHNPRISSGLGVIPRVVSNGRAIYDGKIPYSEARARIETYWHPYHQTLSKLLIETRARFGQAILVDCHSMPHEAVEAVTQIGKPRPDVVIGDRFGASASGTVVDQIETVLLQAGLTVSRNAPFAGAYITQHYGRPSRGIHAIQIELDRALYMDERNIRPLPGFRDFKARWTAIMQEIAQIGQSGQRLAAE